MRFLGAQGDPDAGRRARQRHGARRPRNSRRSTAGFWHASSTIPPIPAYHRNTTGPEILPDFAGKRLDYFVTGWGTGGTLTGAGEMIKLARPGREDHRGRAGGGRAACGQTIGAAQDPGLDAGLRAGRAQSRGPDRIVTVTDLGDRERARPGAEAKASSAASRRARPLRRRCRWRATRRRARSSGDAARHGRALSVDAPVRGYCRWLATLKAESRQPAAPPHRRGLGWSGERPTVPLPDPFALYRGGVLHGARIAYESWGELNAARDNAILLFTGLSPSAHAAATAAIRALAGGNA